MMIETRVLALLARAPVGAARLWRAWHPAVRTSLVIALLCAMWWWLGLLLLVTPVLALLAAAIVVLLYTVDCIVSAFRYPGSLVDLLELPFDVAFIVIAMIFPLGMFVMPWMLFILLWGYVPDAVTHCASAMTHLPYGQELCDWRGTG